MKAHLAEHDGPYTAAPVVGSANGGALADPISLDASSISSKTYATLAIQTCDSVASDSREFESRPF
eukprot:4825592-Prorocentrum_lima.AAC.1